VNKKVKKGPFKRADRLIPEKGEGTSKFAESRRPYGQTRKRRLSYGKKGSRNEKAGPLSPDPGVANSHDYVCGRSAALRQSNEMAGALSRRPHRQGKNTDSGIRKVDCPSEAKRAAGEGQKLSQAS